MTAIYSLLVAAVLVGSGSQESEIQKLRDEVKALRAEVAELKAQLSSRSASPDKGRGTTIRGSAWLTRNNGSSDLLRGLKVRLIQPEVPSAPVAAVLREKIKKYRPNRDEKGNRIGPSLQELQKTLDELPPTLPADRAYSIVAENSEYAPTFTATAERATVSTADADVDGRYEITVPRPGRYFLYAKFDSRSHFVEWLIPVESKGGEVKVDLYNENAVTVKSN